MWIRSPAFDLLWILSGIPFGAALTCLSAWLPAGIMVLWIMLLTQTGHLLSPMALAWTHDGFRALMVQRPIKFIVVPLSIVGAATLVGAIAGRYVPNMRFSPDSFSLAAGPTTLAEFQNPFMAMVALYAAWNAYHFGKQAFGITSIYRRKVDFIANVAIIGSGCRYRPSGPVHSCYARNSSVFRRGIFRHELATLLTQRRIDLFYCYTVVWAAMMMPFIPRIAQGMHGLIGWPVGQYPFLDHVRLGYLAAALALITLMLAREWLSVRSLPRVAFILTDGLGLILVFHAGLWGFAIIGLNHWLVAIGLASHVYANHKGKSPWPFALVVMAAGSVLFCLLFVDLRKLPNVGLTTAALYFTVTAVGFRLGLGFVHFLYDRWIYQLSNPQVRATIGRDILCFD